ncbi:Gfo/Idh/MocA family oxidoreductase [Ideonella sp. DXS22W]|uniref:Gfo/Idh/MocA family oxidoreductase n=1 Tax=Pseudaquabacterium inlustre TaxID=2984192 RepID=A0ABU9CLQ8_9BURK
MKPSRIRLGMVGGGEGAFIGAVHRMAARLDDQFELVAGALSATPAKAQRSGQALGLAADRIYDSFEAMAAAEAARPDGIEAVAIVTPNHVHAPAATAFLKAGIHVICDKPVTVHSADARKLAALAKKQGLVFAVTHNYSAYPMVRVARQMVQQGQLGEIRVVQAEYPQDWLAEPLEQSGQKQAAWRTDPAQAGGGAIGDIGSHAWHLADYVTGQPLVELCAELSSFVPGRSVDDNAQVLLRYANGARGAIWASQVAPGHLNDLRLRVYGSQGGIEWRQEQPNQLRYTPLGQPTQVLERGGAGFGAAGARLNRIPGGHPEGYLEAFASLYSEVAQHLRAARPGARKSDRPDKACHFPTIADGLRGVQFIEAVQRSSRAGGRWVKLPAAQD